MTFFQPEQKSLMNYFIGALVIALLAASFWVVWAYNRSVNLEHQISGLESGIRKMETDKSHLQDKIFAILNNVDVKKFSGEKNLVEEKNPQYLKTADATFADLAVSQTK